MYYNTESNGKKPLKLLKNLKFLIIITPKIEFANAFALKWAVKSFAKDSLRVVVTGTNGKSTTAHMIYTILKLRQGITLIPIQMQNRNLIL